nr:CapA family protein [Legionella fallonii]
MYQIPAQHQVFAHELIDTGIVHLIHGHSSHHPIGIELYKNIEKIYCFLYSF